MAVYGVIPSTGVARGGTIAFSGWSPTLGTGDANVGSGSGAAQFNGWTQQDYQIAYNIARGSNRAFLALLKAVTGAAAGGTATVTYKRVQAIQPSPVNWGGGAIPIETVTPVNRTTTAADITAFTALWNRIVNPTTYPADLSGNGGGGKLSYQEIS